MSTTTEGSENFDEAGKSRPGPTGWLALGAAVLVAVGAVALAAVAPALGASTYDSNLEVIRGSSVRNTNHDNSPWRDTPQDQLVIEDHLGPRSDYLGTPGGNSEKSYPVSEGGQFRISCEFSHFAYDDPLVFPGRPGAAHLHMFFGNTDVNAHSTYETLINSGSSTCNGQELNRTAYWAPALFDASGNVRIPMRIGVYYKGYGLARGASQPYPEGAAMISEDIHEISWNEGGTNGPGTGEASFLCTDSFRSFPRESAGNAIPVCGDVNPYGNPTVLEHHIKFQNCLYGDDPSNPDSWGVASAGGWFYSLCEGGTTFPNIEYIIQYELEPGESTEGWFLSSDIDPDTGSLGRPGASTHGDWWGGWHPQINQMWLDNCTNFSGSQPSGCGHGYLTDGGPDNANPLPGPALQLRPQYEGPAKVPAATVLGELCPGSAASGAPGEAAYCRRAGGDTTSSTGGPGTISVTSAPTSTSNPDGSGPPSPTTPTTPTTGPTTPTSPTTGAPTTSPTTGQTTSSTTSSTVVDPTVPSCRGVEATIVGTDGADDLRGTSGDDVIVGLGGDDIIRGGGGDDILCGGDGDDVLWAGRGADVVLGGPGSDALNGGSGADELEPGSGQDQVRRLEDVDVLVAEDGSTFTFGW